MSLKSDIVDNIKNIYGWKTNRKIVVFSVDDYGNVRIDSKQALQNMHNAGLKSYSQFDTLDTLETSEDLELLYEALTSVKDKNNNHAVFTQFAMPCNINFENMAKNDFQNFEYELLPETFSKLKGYENTWALWQEGMEKGLMVPQFHGREHLNLKSFEYKLKNRDHEVLTALKNRSYTCLSSSGFPAISYTAAFEFYEFSENEKLKEIIIDGLNQFEKVFGKRAVQFNAPGGCENVILHETLKENGIKYIDTPWIKSEHLGLGKYKKVINHTGKKNNLGQTFLVRNALFEPTEKNGIDWASYALKQIETAFRWNRPAIVSSHRVNFCGKIDEANRKFGIDELKKLLKSITAKWPDVEFMSANELGDIISKSNK